MKLILSTPAKALNKAYLKKSLKREQIELFKANLARLLDRVNEKESEEHLKNLVSDFLKDTWYRNDFEINTKDRTDLVIHNGPTSAEPAGVLIEVKRPSNKNEMISPDRPNTKALHELLLYYLQERCIGDNREIRHLVVCNIYEWYIFDAADFERFFLANRKLVEEFREWNAGRLPGVGTDWFYQEIAKRFMDQAELPCVCFDLREYRRIVRKGDSEPFTPPDAADRKLLSLYKILSPVHLFKQQFANDSNSLNREFYNELLHIIGLEEVKEKGKKLIRRKPAGTRHDGSLLENTCSFLKTRNRLSGLDSLVQYGADEEEQLFSVGLELCITWLNRLLFLKLLEGQLISYHKGDRKLAFLNSNRITDFDELNELFFEVLAVREEERTGSVREKFGAIPYLNSSLFEESDLERTTVRISELKNRLDLPLYATTVLKDGNGKRLGGSKNTLHYLFEFLDAYDFATEGSAEIQEQNKTIINAAVLGLIFEKINGYRDGSFFTPGFITMYMCRETIRRAVLHKFNERYGWSCADLVALYNMLDRIDLREANEVINSLRICDPAVGSGHFLVSALNEILAIKSELGILADRDGKRLRGYTVAVENDEPIVVCDDLIFQYNYRDAESQRVQETLFHEKETIIENCLFGVDINPKSVAICRLRLWIELLKHAYYRQQTPLNPPLTGGMPFAPSLDKGRAGEGLQLETLPNIDINIKCGNSLVSRFAISGNPNIMPADRKKLKELTERYRRHVFEYKLSPANKAQLRKVIDGLKLDLQNFGLPNDKDLAALRKKENEVAQLGFAFDRKGTEARKKLLAEIEILRERFEEKQRSVYLNAFEWRFEFPEVLDENGEFIGFDVVIGNPPYIRIQDLKLGTSGEVAFYKNSYRSASKGNYDIYVMFVESGLTLLNRHGRLAYILPHKFFNAKYGESLRILLAEGKHLSEIVHFGHEMIFDEAAAYTCLLFLNKQQNDHFRFVRVNNLYGWRSGQPSASTDGLLPAPPATGVDWTFGVGDGQRLLERLAELPLTLEQCTDRIFQGLKTSADKIYIVKERDRSEESVLVYSPEKQAEYRLEPALLHPLVKGGDSSAYRLVTTDRLILFPYEAREDGKVILIPAEDLQERYPHTWAYLLHNREYLEDREKGRMRHAGWYGYVYPKALGVMSLPKVFTPDLAPSPRFSLDVSGACFFTGGAAGGYGILVAPEHDCRFILGILNSKVSGWFIEQTATQMRGGWRSYEARFIRHIPIPTATPAQQATIIELVEKILAAKSPPAPLSQRGEHVEPNSEKGGQAGGRGDLTDIPALEAEIDRLVYGLYGLTEEEIAVVEGAKP